MQRTNTILLTPTLEQEQQLRSLAEASARLWNIANYQRRKALFKGYRLPNYPNQCKTFKATEPFKALGTCKAQALLAKLNEAWGSYLALKRLERRGKLPSHIKKTTPPRYMKDRDRKTLVAKSIYVRNDGYKVTEDTLTLGRKLAIPCKTGDLWVGKQGRFELHYDRLRKKWYGRIPVKVKWQRKRGPHQPTPKRASIDMEICNLAACVIEGSKTAYVYSGRAVLSDWRYWTKSIAKEQGRLVNVDGKRTSKALKTMFQTRTRRLDHAIDAMLRDLFERLEAEGVRELVVGDLKHIRSSADHGSGRQRETPQLLDLQKDAPTDSGVKRGIRHQDTFQLRAGHVEALFYLWSNT